MSGRTVRAGFALLTLAACISATPATAEDGGTNTGGGGSSWVQRWLDPSTAPFIPVPEVDVSPVGGVTLGLIPVWLTVDENDEIRRIIAPDIIHSQYFGWGARGRIFAYPSKDSQWSVVGGGKQQVEREFDAMYVNGLTRADLWTWTVHANFDRSGTPRFYGLGNNSPQSAQTNYVNNQGHVETSIGWNITRQWQAGYLLRWGFVQIGQAVLPALPSIETRFPQLPGLDREEDMHQRLALTYDTRDSTSIPRNGERIAARGGYSNSGLWGSVSYSFVSAEANVYRTVEPWLTVAAHAALRYMPSTDHAPFWALSSVGGDQSVTGERQPLRAFGEDRFIDRDSFAAGAELRTRVTQFKAYSTSVSVELAPFIDLGKVFARNSENPLLHLHKGGGMAFRAVASPFIVGYLDVGFGPEGPAVFTGINYPF
ncbi:MAG TPA: BamA/TamA family outer membrane protein [Burkholderiaceae bacterium]